MFAEWLLMTDRRWLAGLAFLLVLVPACDGTGDDSTNDGASAETSEALSAAPASGFSFARDTNEKSRTVPITKNGDWKVVYSVPVNKLTASERVAVRGEVTLSRCVPSEGAPCKRDTPFDPKVTVKVVLGSSANDASGPELSRSPSLTCSRRDHHCTLVIGEMVTKNLTGNKFVNLVVAAEGNAATSQDLMLVEDHHGGVYVTRMGASADEAGRRTAGKDVSPSSMPIDNVDDNGNGSRRDGHVTLRARVDGVRPNDILDIDAVIVAKVDDGSCDPLIAHQVFVSKNDGADPESSALATLTAHNGTNCLDSTCRYEKSAAGSLPAGTPSTVYVSVVSKAGRSCVQQGDKWHLGAGSELEVRVRR